MIYQHLTFEASIALALTCARFYYSSVFEGFRAGLKSTESAKFAALCMLENDRVMHRYCCHGCLKTHSSAAFSQDELKKGPTERYCLVTKKCLRLNGVDLSFADIMEMKRENGMHGEKRRPIRLFNDSAKAFFSPMKTETTLRVFPIIAAVMGDEFVALCTGLNIPLCPHMRMGDKEVTDLLGFKVVTMAIELRKPDESHKCKRCKTEVAITRAWDPETGVDWCELIIYRTLGRLFSPLEPTWLAHTFASKDPYLDEYMKLTDAWFRANWIPPHYYRNNQNDLAELVNLQPDNDCLFTPITLPTTLSSLKARLFVRAWLIATQVPRHFRKTQNGQHT